MSISTTYSEFILEQLLTEILEEGVSPSVAELISRYDTFIIDNDISKPLFLADTYKVEQGEASSALKFNTCNNAIQKDIRVLYKHQLKISEQSIMNFERWRAEAKILEGRLNILEERINSLLLISKDTAGFFNFIQDNFVDASKTDLINSTAYLNMAKGVVCIGTSSQGATRIDTSSLMNKDVEFSVLTKSNLVSSIAANGSQRKYVVSDINNFWQEKVYAQKPGPITAELRINLKEVKEISRIDLDLHMSNQNSTVIITPLYSTDNYSWKQLPITNFTRSIVDKTTFQFSALSAQWIKFIMTKQGYDQVHNGLYLYEFGVDEIAFYNEGFSANAAQILISKPLYVNDINGVPEEFSKVVLEVCEDVPDGTLVNYYVVVSNEEDMAATGFVAIDPINRVNSTVPTVLDFGDLDFVTISNIGISYDTSGTTNFINPAEDYALITSTSGTVAIEGTATASALRYSFLSTNDRILDYQFLDSINITQGTLEIWRNVSTQGDETKVRGYVNGWGFADPYYKTVVLVSNLDGCEINFGSKYAVVDEVKVSGKVTITNGIHSVWIHKDNWEVLDSAVAVTDLDSLKAADKLYPYNHKYLVEGYSYPLDWSTNEETIYRGFDIVAEYHMQEVSVFDMLHNIHSDDYSRFARDLDAADTGRRIDGSITTTVDPTVVFLLKVKEDNADFINEKFKFRFKISNSLYKYLRFKIELKTEDTSITPFVDSYRIKISS